MKVLIIGGRRFLGPRLVKCLCDRGHEPVLLNRGRTKAPLPTKHVVREIHADCRDVAAVSTVLRNEWFDAVVDTQCFDSTDAERASELYAGRVGKYLLISSVACYGRLLRCPADERHPYMSEQNKFPGEGDKYAAGKRDAEQILLRAATKGKFPLVIIRPSVGYGYARLLSIWGYCTRHVARIRAGKPVVVPDTGESLIQPIHVDDEADIIERALTNDAAIGEAFNCAGPEPVPLWGYFLAHGQAMGLPVQFVELPGALLHGFDPVRGARSTENLVFNHAYDVTKLQRVLGFTHKYSLVEGLRQTIGFIDRLGLADSTCEDDLEDLLIKGYQNAGQFSVSALGEEIRRRAGYVPPTSSPLVSWAPMEFVGTTE